MARIRRSPGGVGDGLPALPSGEPVLARWFAVVMIVLFLLGVALVVWVALNIRTTDLPPAARRPPGTEEVTHQRGTAVLNEDRTTETGVACAPEVTLVGDIGARSSLSRALSTACQLIGRDPEGFASAADGLARLGEVGGRLRIAVFEVSGLDSSTRIEDGVPVVELNPKFQFLEPGATLAAPFLLHEFAHLGGTWPGAAVDVDDELAALRVQALACDLLVLPDDPPRGCLDAEQVLADPDPAGALQDAGYVR